jgi:hypothetical protein
MGDETETGAGMISTTIMTICLVVLAFCGLWLLFNRSPRREEPRVPDALKKPDVAERADR